MRRTRKPRPAWAQPAPRRPAGEVADELRAYADHIEHTDPEFAEELRHQAEQLLIGRTA